MWDRTIGFLKSDCGNPIFLDEKNPIFFVNKSDCDNPIFLDQKNPIFFVNKIRLL